MGKIFKLQGNWDLHKKILVITDNLPDQINGVVTTFKNMESYANRDGYDIVYLDPRQFYHIGAPGYDEVKLSWPSKIGEKIEEISPDFVHIATEGPLGLFGRLWLDSKDMRYNTSYHTKFPDILKKIYHVPLCFSWAYLRWFHKHSGIVLTTTNTMVDDLRKNGFDGKLLSWTRGVNREDLKPSRNFIHKNKKPIVLYVGRISKEKNVEDVCKLSDEYTVIVVGDGPEREKLENKYTNVFFVGYQSGSELANYYAKADVFVFPSRSDTFGIVMIEAMSLGTPVAAYNVPGPVDIVDSETGCLGEDLRENIKTCLKLDRKIVKQKSKKWTWEECWRIFKNNLVKVNKSTTGEKTQ